MNGLDVVIFTGGIGENAPEVSQMQLQIKGVGGESLPLL